MDPTALYYLIAAVLVLVGLIGTVLPALPGLPLVFVELKKQPCMKKILT